MDDDALATLDGVVAPGYEPVRDVFAANLAAGRELGAACAAVVDGHVVVDLWGGYADRGRRRPWARDTLVNIFSTTKGVSSSTLAVAHGRGWLDLDAPVADVWPEFAEGGKEDVTVRTLLAHQAGLCAVDARLDLDVVADPGRTDDAIAGQVPAWTPGTRHGYHGITLGWYEAALLRRLDPAGRTTGRFLAEEVCGPLGLDLHLGLDPSHDVRVADLVPSRYRARLPLHLRKLPVGFVRAMVDPRSLSSRTFDNPPEMGEPQRYLDPEVRRLELPASNGHGTARAVAGLYGELATGGSRLGLSADTLAALAEPAREPTGGPGDLVLRIPTSFALGYCKPWPGFRFGSPSAFGTMGAGGSMGLADPAQRLGFAYVMNRMDFHLVDDPREHALRTAVQRCAAAAGAGPAPVQD